MMRNLKRVIVVILSFTLLLTNSFTSIAQSDTEKIKIASEFFGKGKAASAKRNYREAIEQYTVAIALYPEYIEAYQERGNAKLELKDYKAAIADYDQAIQTCSVWEAQRKARGGGSSFESFRCHDTLPKVYNNRGIAKDRLGNKLGACEDFHEACNPTRPGLLPRLELACKNFETLCNAEVSPSAKNSMPPSSQPEGSSYVGEYSGTWTSKAIYYDEIAERKLTSFQTGTWTLLIDANGKITGIETNDKSNNIAEIKGSIDEDGYVNITSKYPGQPVEVSKGTIIKTRGGHLKGTLTGHWVNAGIDVNLTTEIDLSPKP